MGNRELDQEWVELVKEALEAGISKQQIREYLQMQSQEVKAGYKVM
ncbi:anti-repressor SinI family protein [Rossellomorea sp. DA94]|nr:anti-repressor SinI family protein [Rossellomorea sp. DA94]WGG45484.1 anti-repressor SinI family protein [Rossellomorea sp. DA94]